ncbi:Histone-lysine N-methyltransferase ATX4 [Camellia lanceoleosa]|nr:Histone-lysine N-methyltransferase ATX4 [Camellia lanceoleosa]
MPTLKRCGVSESNGEDDESSVNRKKRKVNGYYPLHLLGEVAVGVIPFTGYGGDKRFSGIAAAAAWCKEVSEVESKLKREEKVVKELNNPVPEASSRTPLVRTSRGRVQVLPSRFNDSILDNWKKDSKSSVRELSLDPEFTPYKEKFNFKTPKIRGQIASKVRNGDKVSYQCRQLPPLLGNGQVVYQKSKNFNVGKQLSSRSTVTSLHERFVNTEKSPIEEPEEPIDLTDIDGLLEEDGEKKCGLYGLNDFVSGDIVWAMSGKNYPAWPAIVLDPKSQAPQQVLSFRVANAVCVMFFGYSGNGTQRDYAWVKRGRIFPFIDFVDRFQGQTDLNDSKPSNLRSAIEEAFLAEQGFTEMLMVEINAAAGNLYYLESIRGGVQEATDSNQESNTQKQLKKSKHSCGICKKIRNYSDSGTWVRCDGCKVWLHAACDKVSPNFSKDLAATDYYCPECRAKFNFELSDSENCQPKVKNNKKNVLPDKVIVVCSGVEGIYFPSLHLVVCKCGSCGTEKQALNEWERHTGSKAKNWKTSVRVKGSMLPLEQWMLQIAEYHARTVVSVNCLKRPQ